MNGSSFMNFTCPGRAPMARPLIGDILSDPPADASGIVANSIDGGCAARSGRQAATLMTASSKGIAGQQIGLDGRMHRPGVTSDCIRPLVLLALGLACLTAVRPSAIGRTQAVD